MLSVSIKLANDKVIGTLEIDSYFFEEDRYNYAFYLRQKREKDRLEARWYSKEQNVIFNKPNISGEFYITCFIRDIDRGDTRKINSDIVMLP